MYYNFLSKTKIPEILPTEMQEAVDYIENKSHNQKEALENAYKIATKRYQGYHGLTWKKFDQVFVCDFKKLWKRTGFMHCHNSNYLLRILLVKSGFFENKNIKNKWTLIRFSPHQYLKIKMNNDDFINIDIWSARFGIKLGKYMNTSNYV